MKLAQQQWTEAHLIINRIEEVKVLAAKRRERVLLSIQQL
jgi:hypothetical protein